MKGSVVWLVRQRRLGAWTTTEREHLRSVMRSASSVSPYLLIWVVPGSLLVLPFMAWFIDRRRREKALPSKQNLVLTLADQQPLCANHAPAKTSTFD